MFGGAMLDRTDGLDAKYFRRRTVLYYQPMRPSVYRDRGNGHDFHAGICQVEDRAERCGYGKSRIALEDGTIGWTTALPPVFW